MQQAFEAQQHFVADAAHELRSPLAALTLQLQLLRKARTTPRQAAQDDLAAGIERARRLVEQLLALARQEAGAAAQALSTAALVDLRELAEQVLADTAEAAQAKVWTWGSAKTLGSRPASACRRMPRRCP